MRWTCSSALAEELRAVGHPVSERTVNRAGYSLQANRKTLEGNPDAQFKYITGESFSAARRAARAKKKELEYRSREWKRKGRPETVNVFPDKDLGKAIPYGILTNDG